MRSVKCIVCAAAAAAVLTAGTGSARASGFELLSRSLLQEPARAAAFFDGGIVLAAGGALAVFPSPSGYPDHILFPLDGEPYSIAINGRAAYVCAWSAGLLAIDLSDPAHPVVASRYDSPKTVTALLCGGELVLSDLSEGISIFDITSPLSPAFIKKTELRPGPVSMAAGGSILALAYDDMVFIARVSAGGVDVLSSFGPGCKPASCFTDGLALYLTSSSGRTARWDISDPSAPRAIEDLPVEGAVWIDLAGERGLAMTGKGRLVPFDRASSAGSRVYPPLEADYADKELPEGVKIGLAERIRHSDVSRDFIGTSVFTAKGMVLTMDRVRGVSLYARDGGKLSFKGTLTTRGFAIDLVASRDYLYVANGDDGIRIGKIDGSGSVEWVGHVQSTVARDVAVDGDHLFLADGNDGLKIYDITDPSSPKEISRHSSPWYLSAVVARDGFAFLAGGLGGAEVVDVSDPAHPRLVWKKKLSEVRGVWADSDYFYLADGFRGFKIYTYGSGGVSLAGSLDTPGWNDDTFADGDLLYLAEGGKGFAVADISDRSAPSLLGKVETGAIAREIHAYGPTVFVACQLAGIAAVDVSDPSAPSISARFDTTDDARGVFADGKFVYLASGAGGVYVFRYHK